MTGIRFGNQSTENLSYFASRHFRDLFEEQRRIGLWAFPVAFKPNGDRYNKKPLVKWKSLQDRPPTDAELKAWYANRKFQLPAAGTPTGWATGIIVVDCDTIEGEEHVSKRGMPDTWQSDTPHGSHDYLRHPGFSVRNKVKFANWPLPFDFRGDGGYVVTPGSVCGDSVYHWVKGHAPSDLPLADAPAWLLTELQKRAEQPKARPSPAPQAYRGSIRPWARKAFDAEVSLLSSAIEGSRNMTLLGVGRRLGQLVGGGELEESTVRTALRDITETWTNEDLAHSLDTLERALAYGKGTPRSAPVRRLNGIRLTGEEPLGFETADASFWSEQAGCEEIDPSFWT